MRFEFEKKGSDGRRVSDGFVGTVPTETGTFTLPNGVDVSLDVSGLRPGQKGLHEVVVSSWDWDLSQQRVQLNGRGRGTLTLEGGRWLVLDAEQRLAPVEPRRNRFESGRERLMRAFAPR